MSQDPSPPAPPGADALGGRLALLDVAHLEPAQRGAYDEIAGLRLPLAEQSGFVARLPDGRLVGPFNGFLYAPEIAHGFNAWGDAQAAHSPLAEDVRQVVILAVGAAWRAAYELYAHTAVGRKAGLPDDAIRAIIAGREPEGVSPKARAAWRFTDALVRTHTVEDATYAEAVAAFGEAGVVAMVHLVGQYLTTSALLNAFRVPVPTPVPTS